MGLTVAKYGDCRLVPKVGSRVKVVKTREGEVLGRVRPHTSPSALILSLTYLILDRRETKHIIAPEPIRATTQATSNKLVVPV